MMFDEIWRMQRKSQKLNRAYLKKVEELRNQGQSEVQIDMLVDEDRNDIMSLDMDLAYMLNDRLVTEAYKLRVPTPSREDKEMWHDFFGRPYLTDKGYSELRSRIRQEKKERLDHRMMWVKDVLIPILSALSVIGSLIVAYTALKLKH
jgi:hypothetical protein